MRGQEMRVCERHWLGVRVSLRAAVEAWVHVGHGGGRGNARLPPDRWGVCADLARGLGGYETRLCAAGGAVET